MAVFETNHITNATPANQIDDKIRDLMTEIVNTLGVAKDTDIKAALFEWYESAAGEGYFGQLRLRGDGTTNGVRIVDLENSEEFRIFVDGDSSPVQLIIQQNTGTIDGTEGTAIWDDLLRIDGTALWHKELEDVETYISDAIDAAIAAAGGSVDSVDGISGSVIYGSPTTGNARLGITAGADGQSLQTAGGVVGWAEQAVPGHALVSAGISGAFTGSVITNLQIGAIRDGFAIYGGNSENVDIPSSGYYLITATVAGSTPTPTSIGLQLKKGSTTLSNEMIASVSDSNCPTSVTVTFVAWLSASDTLNFYLNSQGYTFTGQLYASIVRLS